MRVVLDTNVFVSAVFFHGKPFEVLSAWREGLVTLVVSPEILEEYRRVGEELARRYEGVNLAPLLALVEQHAEVVQPTPLTAPVCRDPDDDKFLACAACGRADVVVSGDRDLLELRRFRGTDIVKVADLLRRLLWSAPQRLRQGSALPLQTASRPRAKQAARLTPATKPPRDPLPA